MLDKIGVILLFGVCLKTCESTTIKNDRVDVRKFPDWLLFGAATSAYQIEGAWNEDGKSANIWDHVTHRNPELIADQSNGDMADDSYHQYKRDVEMMRELGLDYYRFSLSWSRILPTGFPGQINEAGIHYYNNLIDEMLKYNIEPMVTLYHFDLPQKLQDMGGWTNPHIVDWFEDYARVVFDHFADRVKYWITINEPHEVCYQVFAAATMSQLHTYSGFADYLCAKYILLAHARAYHLYDTEYRDAYGGTIGITLSTGWFIPETEKDAAAAADARAFEWEIHAHPIFSEAGDFPPIVKERVAANSAAQGYPRSRLPEFTTEEVEFVRGSADFFGINHYTTYVVYRNESVQGYFPSPSFNHDIGAIQFQPSEWKSSASSWLKDTPWGFYELLTYIRDTYNNPEVFVTENGFTQANRNLNDDDRVMYYRGYLSAMLDAIEDGCNVSRYTAWSLMDNFEWLDGYSLRFGLYEVDFEDPERTRTPRKSAFVYKHIVRTRSLDLNYEPDTSVMTIDEGH